MAKMWRKEGRKGLSTTQYDPIKKDVVQVPTVKGRRVMAKASMQAFRATGGGLAFPVANLLKRAEGSRVQPAHEYIPMPSNSKAVQQNVKRKQAMAGRVLTLDEVKQGAVTRRMNLRLPENITRKELRVARQCLKRLGTADFNRYSSKPLSWD